MWFGLNTDADFFKQANQKVSDVIVSTNLTLECMGEGQVVWLTTDTLAKQVTGRSGRGRLYLILTSY